VLADRFYLLFPEFDASSIFHYVHWLQYATLPGPTNSDHVSNFLRNGLTTYVQSSHGRHKLPAAYGVDEARLEVLTGSRGSAGSFGENLNE